MAERWPAKVSVAGMIENQGMSATPGYYGGGVLLVTQRDSGLIGFIAGGMEKGEQPREALLRELREETLLTPDKVKLSRRQTMKLIPREENTAVGIMIGGHTVDPIAAEGYDPEVEEISLVKPYSIDEVLDLTRNPDGIYKRDFNEFFLNMLLWEYIQMKYAFEDWPGMQVEMARSWGVWDEVIRDPSL